MILFIELGVLIRNGMLLSTPCAVFCPKKRQGNTGFCQFIVDVFEVREFPAFIHSAFRIKQLFNVLICESIWYRPAKIFILCQLLYLSNSIPGTAATASNAYVAVVQTLKPDNLSIIHHDYRPP